MAIISSSGGGYRNLDLFLIVLLPALKYAFSRTTIDHISHHTSHRYSDNAHVTKYAQALRSQGPDRQPTGSCVVCTQPRRVAAVTVARRVAEELEVEIGQEVG